MKLIGTAVQLIGLLLAVIALEAVLVPARLVHHALGGSQ